MIVVSQAHENLLRWSIHASLGKTVYEIVQKFIQDPPLLVPQNPPPTGNMGPTTMQQQSPQSPIPPSQPLMNSPMQSFVQQPQSKSHTPLPVVPSAFPELDGKSPMELAQLLNDENEFRRFFDSLNAVQTMRKVRDDMRTNNEELAKKNLAKEAELEKIRRELGARQQVISEKRGLFEQKAQRQQEVMKQFSTQALIEHLGTSAGEAEAASDAIANQFLSGEIDQKTFIKEFMEKRKLFHLRAAKKESLIMLAR